MTKFKVGDILTLLDDYCSHTLTKGKNYKVSYISDTHINFKQTDEYARFGNYQEHFKLHEFQIGDKIIGTNCNIEGCEGVIEDISTDNNFSIRLTKLSSKIWQDEDDINWQVGKFIRIIDWSQSIQKLELNPTWIKMDELKVGMKVRFGYKNEYLGIIKKIYSNHAYINQIFDGSITNWSVNLKDDGYWGSDNQSGHLLKYEEIKLNPFKIKILMSES